MKKLTLLLSSAFMLFACANDWSSSGVPDIYEGQSKESVMRSLEKNHWIIHEEKRISEQEEALLASGKPTEQFSELFATECREAAFLFIKDHGLQALETRACGNKQ